MSSSLLVVEDDPDIADTLAELLEDAGYRVATAGNGRIALDHLQLSPELPDLILLDLMMPVMDGWQFREAQQSDPRLAGVPVILLSASVKADQAAQELGVRALLRKPVDIEALLRAIAQHTL
jgi:CheY-like chemotaxis protein